MTEDADTLAEARSLLAAQWGAVPRIEDAALTRALLVEALAERIAWLLRHDPNRLLTAMYLLDVGEARFRAAIDHPAIEDRAEALAELVFDRETEKIRTRRRYARRDAPAPEDPPQRK